MKAGGLVLYAAGQLGVMLLARFFMQWLIRFADEGQGTSQGTLFAAATVGAVFLGFRVFDSVTDPLAGMFADSWVAKGRQRRSLIWLSFAIPPVGLALVFAPTLGMSPELRWIFLTAGMFLFFVGYTLYAIPYWSLVEDYSQGNVETRTALSNCLGIGVLVATGLGFVLSPMLVEKLGFLMGSIIFGGVGMVLMIFPYFAAPKNLVAVKVPQAPSLLKSLSSGLRHRRFLAVILLFSGAQMSLTVMTSAAPYIAEKILMGTLGDVAWLLGPFLLTSVLTFGFVPRLSRRYGWETATVVGVIALSVAYVGAGLLGRGIIGTPIQTAMIVFACAGPGAAFVLGLEAEAIARCAEESEHKSTGMYFGIYNFVVKALNGVALFMTGILAGVGSPGAVRAMPILAGALCAVGVILYKLSKPPMASKIA
jgi:Na+/melibiose symporter-like transporter